jgi:hypothetical protein
MLPVRRTSTIASTRLATWLASTLRAPLYDSEDLALKESHVDNLLIVNGSTLYCKYLPELAEFVRTSRNVVWIQNDYTLPPPKSNSAAESPFRKAFAMRSLIPHYWTTCGENATKTAHSAQVNWNVLGYDKHARRSTWCGSDFFYYGAYRQRREQEFRYMLREAGTVTVSSTSLKFLEMPGVNLVDPIRTLLVQELSMHGMGIYCQDDRSADANHCPATRFYEMLSAGLPMCFTPGSVKTLSQYGYDVSQYVLTKENRAELMGKRSEIAAQQSLWVEDFESELTKQVTRLHAELDK